MVVERPFSIANSSGDIVRGDPRYEEGGTPKPLLIVCDGSTAHKDWGPFPYFGERFAQEGFASILFNFSHNGIGGNFKRFTELEKFSRNTISKELEDVMPLSMRSARSDLGATFVTMPRLESWVIREAVVWRFSRRVSIHD